MSDHQIVGRTPTFSNDMQEFFLSGLPGIEGSTPLAQEKPLDEHIAKESVEGEYATGGFLYKVLKLVEGPPT